MDEGGDRSGSVGPRGPSPPPARVEGYDVARALAYFGMVLVHFRLVGAAEDAGPRWLAWLVGRLDGRAAATFVTLAGVGLALMARGPRLRGDRAALAGVRRVLLRRALFLLMVGLLYFEVWPADILHCYGIFLAVGALMLAAPDRLLMGAAAGLVLAYVPMILAFDYGAGWDWETLTYRGFWTPAGMLRNVAFNGFNPVVPWTAFLLFGLWLGRRDLGDPAVGRRVLRAGLATALTAEAASVALVAGAGRVLDAEAAGSLFGTAPMPPMPLFMLAAGGTAAAVIASCVLLTGRCRGARWIGPLAATGQMALTLYVAHVVVGLGALEAVGVVKGRSVAVAVAAAAAFCAASVVGSALWRRRFARGPLEWAMRRLAGG